MSKIQALHFANHEFPTNVEESIAKTKGYGESSYSVAHPARSLEFLDKPGWPSPKIQDSLQPKLLRRVGNL